MYSNSVVNSVPLLSIQIGDRAEALHLNLLWELVLYLDLSELSGQQLGLWESVWAARSHKLIGSSQEPLWLREQHKNIFSFSHS